MQACIIIIANLLPSMLGAGMTGNVEGGGLLVHGVDPRPGSMCSSLEKPPEQELEGAVSVGEVLLCL